MVRGPSQKKQQTCLLLCLSQTSCMFHILCRGYFCWRSEMRIFCRLHCRQGSPAQVRRLQCQPCPPCGATTDYNKNHCAGASYSTKEATLNPGPCLRPRIRADTSTGSPAPYLQPWLCSVTFQGTPRDPQFVQVLITFMVSPNFSGLVIPDLEMNPT